MIKSVLFDIDGTLQDTSDFIFLAIDYTFKKFDLTTTDAKIEQAKGKPLIEFYKYLFPNKDYLLFAKTHKEFQENKFGLIKTIPGVEKVLKKLKEEGIKIAAVSNRTKTSLIKSLKQENLYQFFDAVVTPDDVENPKPHKEHPLKAMELIRADRETTIIVGDTENDIFAGKAAGIKTVGVTYGWMGNKIKNFKPDFVIDDISELLQVLKLS